MIPVTLRPFTREEYHAFYEAYEPDPIMDPNPYRYSYEHVDRSYDYDLSRRDVYPVFGIFTAGGEPVGTLSLKRVDRERGQCEIGIVMRDERCKNRGFGTQALRQGIAYAADTLGLRRICGDTMGSNLRMQHLFAKLGFRLVSRVAHVYDMGDRWEDKLDYVLEVADENPDWHKQPE